MPAPPARLGQFCFDNDLTARFRDDAARAGITIPIVPGVMPTTNFKGVARMAAKAGASIPAWLAKAYDGLDEDVETRRIVAAAVLADQVEQLCAARLRPVSFLYAQPGQSDLCGLPHSRHCAQGFVMSFHRARTASPG